MRGGHEEPGKVSRTCIEPGKVSRICIIHHTYTLMNIMLMSFGPSTIFTICFFIKQRVNKKRSEKEEAEVVWARDKIKRALKDNPSGDSAGGKQDGEDRLIN